MAAVYCGLGADTSRSRLQRESPGEPRASRPRLVALQAGTVEAAFDSSMRVSPGPLVRPVMMALFGMVS